MIYTVGKSIPESELYSPADWQQFIDWLRLEKAYQFDLETNITRTSFGRKIRTMQFGEVRTCSHDTPGIRFVIHWWDLTDSQKDQILQILGRRDQKKYIHNAIFEYETMLNYNVVLENVFDTMLAEQIKWTGYFTAEEDEWGNSFFSLAGCMQRYFNILLDKSYQTAFIDEFELTPGHIIYAADDVTHLDMLSVLQVQFLEQEGLINVLNLENEAVLAFGDITWNGMLIDRDKWIKNLEMAEPVVQQYREALNQWLLTDAKLNKEAKRRGYIYTEDTVEFNPNSPVHKKQLLQRIFPDIDGATLPIIKRYLKLNDHNSELGGPYVDSETYEILEDLANQDWQSAFLYLVRTDKQFLIDNGYLIPEGTIKLNWNSTDQVLPLFQQLDKKLQDLSEKSRNTFEHPIVVDYEKFKKGLKLTSSYGLSFLEMVDLDGRVRTRFNQILATGRVSSSKPNMQQIPNFEDDDPEIAYRYRRAFYASPGFTFVDADYAGQELVVIAELSQEPVWLNALRNGWDLHSSTAAMVFKAEWERSAEPGCAFVANKQKCKCKRHKVLRQNTKEINFGLIYGMSVFKLAGTLKITVPEAQAIMDLYFSALPALGKCLTNIGGYGVQTGVIKTMAPFFRKRWFPKWDKVRTVSRNTQWVSVIIVSLVRSNARLRMHRYKVQAVI
jgi:DNA polymerase I-like protein with 3'-5' exonuclease and polymerase domains